jgi:hypothetical protein
MAVIRCKYCDAYIDLDWNVEHEDECGFELGILDEDGKEVEFDHPLCPYCKKHDYPLENTYRNGKPVSHCSRCCAEEEDRKPKAGEEES